MDKSHWEYIKERVKSSKEHKHLWDINKELILENKILNEKLTKIESLSQVDKQTINTIQDEIIRLQNEIYDLKGELEFYNVIMNAAKTSKGLNIQGLLINHSSSENNYIFKLVLTHVSKEDKPVEGKAEMIIYGTLNGTASELNIADISQFTANQLDYKFKNFKRITGNFMLPDGFVPDSVQVKLYPKGEKLTNIDKVFIWADATN